MERPWSVAVRIDDVPESGRHLELKAGADVLAALAKPAGVEAVERLVAHLHLTRRGRDGLHVSGSVEATVRQACVVTLEPVVSEIDEAVAVDFAPPREIDAGEIADPVSELTPGSDDEAEPLVGNSVDLGLLATEFLILGVDPYPRKPDAAFALPEAGEPAAHPFEALAAWNKKGTVKE